MVPFFWKRNCRIVSCYTPSSLTSFCVFHLEKYLNLAWCFASTACGLYFIERFVTPRDDDVLWKRGFSYQDFSNAPCHCRLTAFDGVIKTYRPFVSSSECSIIEKRVAVITTLTVKTRTDSPRVICHCGASNYPVGEGDSLPLRRWRTSRYPYSYHGSSHSHC